MSMKELAQHIIAVAHENKLSISNLQLQKVMYFAIQEMLKQDEKKFAKVEYDEPFLVWRYGPVEKNIYEKYSIYGADPITDKPNPIDKYSKISWLNEFIKSKLEISVFDMVKQTHLEKFWKDNSQKIDGWVSDIEYKLGDIWPADVKSN